MQTETWIAIGCGIAGGLLGEIVWLTFRRLRRNRTAKRP